MGNVLVKLFGYPSSDDPTFHIIFNTIVSIANIFSLIFVSFVEGYTNYLQNDRLLSPEASPNLQQDSPERSEEAEEQFRPEFRDWKWIICFLLIIVLQFILTVCFDTEGFSLVWSSLMGWSVAAIKIRKWRSYYLYVVGAALLADFVALFYYFITGTNLTTTAHLCGISFGAVLALIYLEPAQEEVVPYFAQRFNDFEY